MRLPTLACAVAAGILLATPAGSLAAQDATDGWVEETPGGDTGCAFDTPYRFFHRGLGDAVVGPSDLLVYFQGGGACWSWVSCSGMFDTSVVPDELAGLGGIFDRDAADNPFRGFAIVFVSYCTGDVHVGDTIRRYGDPGTARPVAHRGAANVAAVLEWLEGRVVPTRVVVAGASAGAYGALFHTPAVTRRFPDARIVMLGDSGVPLLDDYPAILRAWGAVSALAGIRGGVEPGSVSLSLIAAYERAAADGRVRIAQITADRDAVQGAFYMISGSHGWRDRTYALLAEVSARVPGFRSYVVAGADHGLLRTDRFYEYEAGGMALRDWVSDLIVWAPVDDVRCEVCVPPDPQRERGTRPASQGRSREHLEAGCPHSPPSIAAIPSATSCSISSSSARS